MRRIYGIDFSGAEDAGRKVWIASGVKNGGRLHIDICCRAMDFLKTSADRDECLGALEAFIRRQRDAAFGIDFPFGLPREFARQCVGGRDWEGFVRAFCCKFGDFTDFDKEARSFGKSQVPVCGRQLLRRLTDEKSRTTWSPYHPWLRRQTYHGICDVLWPLVRDRAARVIPMQTPERGMPWLLEICPKSTLIHLKLHPDCSPYKGNRGTHEARLKNRRHILCQLKSRGVLLTDALAKSDRVVGDDAGDALDSVIAAFATCRADLNSVKMGPDAEREHYMVEGYVYV